MYAVIRAGGKQYKVSPGDVVRFEKVNGTDGRVEFADVLGFPVFSLLELPHAASDTAVAPVTARITS